MAQIYTVPEGIRSLRADKALALAFREQSSNCPATPVKQWRNERLLLVQYHG